MRATSFLGGEYVILIARNYLPIYIYPKLSMYDTGKQRLITEQKTSHLLMIVLHSKFLKLKPSNAKDSIAARSGIWFMYFLGTMTTTTTVTTTNFVFFETTFSLLL